MIKQIDLLNEISNKELLELSDLDGNNKKDDSVITDAIETALALISSFITIPPNPTPLLKKIAVDFTIIELRRKNEISNDADKELKKINESYLLKMANNRIKTNTTDDKNTKKSGNNFAFRHKKNRLDLKGFSL
jgi:phage gp36-like protein